MDNGGRQFVNKTDQGMIEEAQNADEWYKTVKQWAEFLMTN